MTTSEGSRSCVVGSNTAHSARRLPKPSRARRWAGLAVDFLYPPACPVCQREVADAHLGCTDCRGELLSGVESYCEVCSAPVGPHLPTVQGCIHCAGDRFAFDRAIALGPYEGLLRQTCLRAKQDRSERLSRLLADLLWTRREAAFRTDEYDAVVPIPDHWTARITRSASPAACLADHLARLLKVPCDRHILRKPRRTPPQSTLSPTLRRENLKDAFRMVRGVRMTATQVLLVDDVLTTGTTAHRAARVLRKAGAERVTVAVVARGIGR